MMMKIQRKSDWPRLLPSTFYSLVTLFQKKKLTGEGIKGLPLQMDSFHILLLGYISDGLIPIKEKRCRSSNRQHNRARQDPKRKEKEKKKEIKKLFKIQNSIALPFPSSSILCIMCVCVAPLRK